MFLSMPLQTLDHVGLQNAQWANKGEHPTGWNQCWAVASSWLKVYKGLSWSTSESIVAYHHGHGLHQWLTSDFTTVYNDLFPKTSWFTMIYRWNGSICRNYLKKMRNTGQSWLVERYASGNYHQKCKDLIKRGYLHTDIHRSDLVAWRLVQHP